MTSHATRSGPVLILRAEAAGVFVLLLWAYALVGQSWWLFLALLLVPDISMLGYLAGNRAGAIAYNMAHTAVGPLLLAASVWLGAPDLLLALAIIWAAHIALDRALGYGLKFSSGFSDTHLGRIGRRPAD